MKFKFSVKVGPHVFLVAILILSGVINASSGRTRQKRFIGGLVNKVVSVPGEIIGGVVGGLSGGYSRGRGYGGGGGGGFLGGGGGGSQSNAQASSYNHNVKGCLGFNLLCLGVGSSGAQATADSASQGGDGYGGSGSQGGAFAGNNGFDGGSFAGANGGGYGWRR